MAWIVCVCECVCLCLSLSVCVSSGRLVGQHVSAPALSLSQAVISTYHSERPEREDMGTHNPHSVFFFASSTLEHSTLLSDFPLFSFGCELLGSRSAKTQRVSPAKTEWWGWRWGRGVSTLLQKRGDPGKAAF